MAWFFLLWRVLPKAGFQHRQLALVSFLVSEGLSGPAIPTKFLSLLVLSIAFLGSHVTFGREHKLCKTAIPI